MFEGERNDTSTLIDVALFDVPSRKMLFRAPGTSQVKGSATIVNLTEQTRKDSQRGFELAAADVAANLKQALSRFNARLKEKPGEVEVVYSENHKGRGGSLGLTTLLVLVSVFGVRTWGGLRRP